ncbi:MAG: aminotransferase class I/II-fold pyridoxal phosphate-dependent enzyme [Patescibacteria group bacterium]
MRQNGIVTLFGSTAEMLAEWGGHYVSGLPQTVKLEKELGKIHGMPTLVTTRGMTAITAAVFAFLPARVILSNECYPGTMLQFREWKGADVIPSLSLFDPDDLDGLENQLSDPLSESSEFAIVFVESIGNSRLMKVANVPAIIALCKKYGAMLVVDTTFTPLAVFEPDSSLIVVGSLTKYEQPDDEAMGGRISSAAEIIAKIRATRAYGNVAMLPSVAAYYLLQAIGGFDRRFLDHSDNAFLLSSEKIRSHSAVKAVHYPGSLDHPGYSIIQRDFSCLAGGVLYLEFKGGDEAARLFCDKLVQGSENWSLAVSFGSSDWRICPIVDFLTGYFDYRPGLVRIATGRINSRKAISEFIKALDWVITAVSERQEA